MIQSKYKPIIEVFFLSIIAFLLHKTILFLLGNQINETDFHYSLLTLYLFFLICSSGIVFILIKVMKKNIDIVGQTFLLLTSIKMVVAYILLHPILQESNKLVASEKINFYTVFALFLAIETIVTIRILNKK